STADRLRTRQRRGGYVKHGGEGLGVDDAVQIAGGLELDLGPERYSGRMCGHGAPARSVIPPKHAQAGLPGLMLPGRAGPPLTRAAKQRGPSSQPVVLTA